MVGGRCEILRRGTLARVGDDTAVDAHLTPSRATDGDAAHAGARSAQQLRSYGRHGRADAKPRAHHLRVPERGGLVEERAEDAASGVGREAGHGETWKLTPRKSQRHERTLFDFVSFRRSRRGTCAGRPLDGQHRPVAGKAADAADDVRQGAHIRGFFLYPDNVSRGGMLLDSRLEFFFRERVHLFQEENRGFRIFSLLSVDV